ncbi:hypothetical protein FisN_3Hu289 [Fistulifera solaris]|jgi:S1-C subfamily serine protease|uniref:PDZ domain-containing protein n=1 Tax=Fistulifera solaris TaxID=1519565 RepID=A0A1Z5JQJ7_FISSO|nr:hypothetical protein FisN_3Hu289 [Fistulifera solaris]|eukprot:GAX16229.1 hypothetical protein FisN_3Hu289 [Fistulifera solaris]
MLTFFTSNALKAPEGRQSLSTVAGSKHATELKNETSPASRELRLDFVTETVRKVGPAVVRIIAETKPSKGIEGPSDEVRQNFGSGFIFSEDGLILTKAHGMEEADKITVSLPDGREYEAIVKGIDPIVDIAVLKIVSANESNEFPVAKLVDSDVLNVGQIVVAIGNPAEFDNTVTMGIVSGLGRSSTTISGPHIKVDYIQTDVAMNSGSSGGPLIDVETGDVVGINAGSVDSMAGTTFSIPINRIRHIIDSLSQGREVQHGYLGLSVMKCTPAWARQINAKLIDSSSYRAPEIHGVFVQTVHPFTPAEKGELRLGDVIIEVGGEGVQVPDDLRRFIDRAAVGEV